MKRARVRLPIFSRPRSSALVGKFRSLVRVDSEFVAVIRGKSRLGMQSTWRRHISKRKALEDDRFSVCGWYDGISQCAEI